MKEFFWVCLGGAAGTGARYLVSVASLHFLGARFPWGTLAVNVIGSFVMGVLMARGLPDSLRVPLTTGVLGGFTTYSAFNYELTQDGFGRKAALYLAVTVVTCLAAGFAGLALGSDSTPRN